MLVEMHPISITLRRLRKAEKWTGNDEAKLEAERKTLESMKSEALRMPWADMGKRKELRRTVRNLGRRKARSSGEEAALSGAKKALEEMKSEAMRLPWFNPPITRPLRISISQLEDRKRRAADNAAKLELAEKAFGVKRTEAMRCLWANAGILCPTEDGAKPKFLSGDYGSIHRHIKHEQLEEARSRLDCRLLFLNSNKPRFILDELSESPDSYLAPVLGELRPAVVAFEAKDLKTAQKHFAQAALEMRKIVFP